MTATTRTWLALCLLVVPCLAFSIAKLSEVSGTLARAVEKSPASGYVDRVTRAERRYDPVRATLPSRGIVGYVLKARSPSMLEWYREYGLIFAQYTLAPLQVEIPKLFRPPTQAARGWPGLPWNVILGICDLLSRYDAVIEEYDESVHVTRRTAP